MKALTLLQRIRRAYEDKELRLYMRKLSITEIDEAIAELQRKPVAWFRDIPIYLKDNL